MKEGSEERWLGYQDSNLGMPGSKPGALPLGDTPSGNSTTDCIKMAGVPGFEPGNARIKTWCLTAWRYPNLKFCSTKKVDGAGDKT